MCIYMYICICLYNSICIYVYVYIYIYICIYELSSYPLKKFTEINEASFY